MAEMVAVAEEDERRFHLRPDRPLYVEGRVLFGEVTHCPGDGVATYRPRALNEAISELWRHGTPIPERFRLPAA